MLLNSAPSHMWDTNQFPLSPGAESSFVAFFFFFDASSPSVPTVPVGMTLVLFVTLSFCCKQLSICPARLHLSGVNISSIRSRVTPWGSPAHLEGLM